MRGGDTQLKRAGNHILNEGKNTTSMGLKKTVEMGRERQFKRGEKHHFNEVAGESPCCEHGPFFAALEIAFPWTRRAWFIPQRGCEAGPNPERQDLAHAEKP